MRTARFGDSVRFEDVRGWLVFDGLWPIILSNRCMCSAELIDPTNRALSGFDFSQVLETFQPPVAFRSSAVFGGMEASIIRIQAKSNKF